MPCSGCLKVRRALINKTPKRIAAPLARTFLPTVTDGPAVVREARTWVGVPFRHQGRDRNGIDCIGLPIVILNTLGAVVPEYEHLDDYPRQPPPGDLERRFLHVCTPLPEPVPGCVVAIRKQVNALHVAIVTDDNKLIHVLDKRGVIDHGFVGMWRTRFYAGSYALPGVRYG